MELMAANICMDYDLVPAAFTTRSLNYPNLDAGLFWFGRQIERDAGCPSAFRTVHGVGYKLRAAVEIMLRNNVSI